MTDKSGRLQFLAPHYLRSHLLRPNVIRLCLRLGLAQQMPAWAKLQFINQGVSGEDLDQVLGRVTGLESWVDEWEALGKRHLAAGRAAVAAGHGALGSRALVAAAAAFNFAQYVLFFDIQRKRALHEACVSAFAEAATLLDPPARPVRVRFRRHDMEGYLRLPRGRHSAPLVVLFNGTNAVKEELHIWSEALLEQGLAVLSFDGPGLGRTWHRLSMVAEPRPVGVAIMDAIENIPEVDASAVAFAGMSLGGYLAIRMASHESRIKAVAAVSPPFSADIYWNVTLASMRRELAALYDLDEATMSAWVDRITLAEVLPSLRCPMLVVGGGRDFITPGREAWRIFENARCERELIYYPTGAHDCFNVLADLRPRLSTWLARQLMAPAAAAPAAMAADSALAAAPRAEPEALAPRPAPRGLRWLAAPVQHTRVVLKRARAVALAPLTPAAP